MTEEFSLLVIEGALRKVTTINIQMMLIVLATKFNQSLEVV